MAASKRLRRSRELSKGHITESAEETRAWGRKFAGGLKSGDCLLLIGELGVGKTTLVQGLAEGLGIDPRDVISPTFVLIREHEGEVPLYHVDAYRISAPEELVEVGFLEYFGRPGITVIEWGEKVRSLAPKDALEIHLEHLGGQRRRIRVKTEVG